MRWILARPPKHGSPRRTGSGGNTVNALAVHRDEASQSGEPAFAAPLGFSDTPYARSNFLVPVPAVDSLVALNALLEDRCRRDLDRPVRGKPGTSATLLVEDQAAFLPLPPQPFEARRVTQAAADSLSRVRFDTNSYSVPTRYAHRRLTAVATIDEVRVVHEDRLVAPHPRCWERE